MHYISKKGLQMILFELHSRNRWRWQVRLSPTSEGLFSFPSVGALDRAEENIPKGDQCGG